MLNKHRSGRSPFQLVGWLFADLLLALTMIFVVASAVEGVYIPRTGSTPTPTSPVISALSSKSVDVTVRVDAQGLLNNDPTATRAVQNQVQSQLQKYGKLKAGMVLTFGGGPDQGQDTDIAKRINEILSSMGSKHFVFDRAVFRSFIDLSKPSGTDIIEIYFFIYGSK